MFHMTFLTLIRGGAVLQLEQHHLLVSLDADDAKQCTLFFVCLCLISLAFPLSLSYLHNVQV